MAVLASLATLAAQFWAWLNAASPPMIAGSFLVVGALIALAGVLFTATLTNYTATKTQARTLFVGTVTSERAQWRQELRQAVGDLIRLTYLVVTNTGASDDAAKLQGVRAMIRLRLNPTTGQGHERDQAVLAGLAELATAIKAGDGSRAITSLDMIEENVQALLKQEWEKSKDEARTGRLFGSRLIDNLLNLSTRTWKAVMKVWAKIFRPKGAEQ